jgi:hypothetical protein
MCLARERERPERKRQIPQERRHSGRVGSG